MLIGLGVLIELLFPTVISAELHQQEMIAALQLFSPLVPHNA